MLSLVLRLFLLLGFLSVLPLQASAQEPVPPEFVRAFKLFEESNFTEALPLLEKLAKAHPSDEVVLERLGWAAFALSISTKDPKEREKLRDQARTALMRSKELGGDSELMRVALEALSQPDNRTALSQVKESDEAMREGEAAYTRGDLDKAIVYYDRALRLDPKLYLAALFLGDMYFKKGYQATEPKARDEHFNKAGEWFARAISIEPNAETAHRYWGDALMHQGKQQEAMMKFIDGIIAEPGNRRAYVGLSQWGDRNQVSMGHPAIDIPVKVSPAVDKKINVVLAPGLGERVDGSLAWEQYGAVRTKWMAEDFARAYPKEPVYRHTLREEVEALRKTAEAAAELLKMRKVESLSPSLAALVKLNGAGLLEPYIFFALVDEGIGRDYDDYRRANPDKLRRYWTDVVISR
jgi:tetratricopeptide (TPR) repeat protein